MQTCTRCLFDEHIPGISFNADGVCSYCHQYDSLDEAYPTGEHGLRLLEEAAEQIRRDGRGKPYDLIVGVSGGCDSSYMMYLAKELLNLRPLAVHFDNTWNSRIAVENIQRVTSALDIDLYTHVVDNREYCDVFRSFMLASVPEIDTPSDIGLATTLYQAAHKFKLKYIFEGHSFRTEGISPPGWFYMDARYITSIQQRFGSMSLKTLPNLYLTRWLKWAIVNRIRRIRPLYHVTYNKEETKRFLQKQFDWQWYGGHHMENRTAYFVNNYYLPRKFGIDLRYCEYSALVRSRQMAREDAIAKLREPKPFDKGILEEVKKRLGFTDEQFDQVMSEQRHTFMDYPTYKQVFERYRWLFWMMYKADLVPASFYHKFTRRYTRDDLKSIYDGNAVRLVSENRESASRVQVESTEKQELVSV